MHCFSGDADFARACLDRGAYLSFAGTVTFKNAEPLREALRVAPLDRILVETDAPYLTPMPHRGRTNASYLVPLTVRSMADDARRRPGRALPRRSRPTPRRPSAVAGAQGRKSPTVSLVSRVASCLLTPSYLPRVVCCWPGAGTYVPR